MYSCLIAKHQFKITVGLWQQKQYQKLTASVVNIVNYSQSPVRNCTFTAGKRQRRNQLHNEQLLHQRPYTSTTQQLAKNEKPPFVKFNNTSNAVKEDEEEETLITNFDYKHLLYTEEDDDIMRRLNAAQSTIEIKTILEAEKSNLNKEHIVQSLILQWMFKKINDSTHPQDQKGEQYLTNTILMLLQSYVSKLDINELSICYLYLRKMGIENIHPVAEQLLINALSEIENSQVKINLQALSRLLIGINTGQNFFMPMVCAKFLRHLQHHIDVCQSAENARMIAICLYNLQAIVDNEMMNVFKKRVTDLISCGEISNASPKTVIKILNLLNLPVWSHRHGALIIQLLLTMKPSIKELNEKDLKTICRIYEYHMEPASLHEPLAEAIEGLLNSKMTPETLACYVPFSKPLARETLTNAVKALLSSPESWQMQNASLFLFSALRGLKISDPKTCNSYWNGVIAQMAESQEEETNLRFLRHCRRYMNFHNNLGGTYRHMELENKLSQMCMKAIEYDLAGRIPQKFSRLASFVIAYGHTPHSWRKYPNILLSRIISMAGQFSPTDCFFICRGIQISLELRYRFQLPQLVGMQISTIDAVLRTCIERHLNNEELSITDLNTLVRAFNNRKGLKNSVLYHNTLQKYKDVQDQELNARIIKDMAFNFIGTNYFIPEMLDKMFAYLEHNREHVRGETVEKILSCGYNLGYTPESSDSLYYAGEILLRDFNYMSGLTLVQACLALCYYKTIPEELINKVFCVQFIQRVEEEIQLCYSKATYPDRVLNIIMQLNRSVCLDFPEANVPWFQQSFIEAQISKKPLKESNFSLSVKNLLTSILKNESYIRCNHVTPYGYQIDFIINFDKSKNPIEAPVETTMLDRITKVAILLLKFDSFCENDLSLLKGPDSMKVKHLEMMGYKVLHINEHDWNSKYMNVPGAKQNYLKCLLQISN